MLESAVIKQQNYRLDAQYAIETPAFEGIDHAYSPNADWYSDFWNTVRPKFCNSSSEDLVIPTRLGIYFETLWLKAIDAHPDYQLICANLQVNGEGRTLGSFDFLVRYIPDQTIEHWELASKFYLALPLASEWIWLGPNLNDYWQLKKQKMLSHQIQLGQRPEAKDALAAVGIGTIDKHRLVVKGRVYWPTTEANKLHWMTQQQWSSSQQTNNLHPVYEQPKHCWLGLSSNAPQSINLTEQVLTTPILITQNGTQSFIVPNQWPEQAKQKAAGLGTAAFNT
ncbi:DUF1853 family protein [Echinimonas agarilytica]|uniref:DUF1853 family protein n=1 Tax=Echinimonas agarilytica TaxID=1215918 RepID=A0AA42B7H0_9GAMM|nr:DUF1853 family protein [Echinimonas agarilytica]MCM2679990.1 DUF1853 family protein [Echinimonas agarilytica]